MSGRDFSTISPSARWLLLAKSHSDVPFAREVAEIVCGPESVAAAAQPGSIQAAMRQQHFVLRARSIDEALDGVGAKSVVEIAAGFSFRGLARASRDAVHYLDTDLPELIELKRDVLARLAPGPLVGTYRVEPLDAMDAAAFARAVASLPDGPVTIVQEGLLMYLDDDEKARLAATIRSTLVTRGGRWITADIYLRREGVAPRETHVEKFIAEHRVEEQKFASWDAAETFFRDAGFKIEHRLVGTAHPDLMRQTWILDVV